MTKSRAGSKSFLVAPLIGLTAAALTLVGCSSNSANSAANSTDGSSGSSNAGFQVNTADCTDPAKATKKITGAWKIGFSLALSGPVAGGVAVSQEGFKARIAAQNAAGGIDGVKIGVDYKDDAFTPDRAKTNITQFLQSDHVDSIASYGSGPLGAMADAQNAACVPALYPFSAVAQYNNISQYPWTLQFLPQTTAEAAYDIALLKSKFPNGATVGVAENQTESGKGYSTAFQQAAKASGDIKVTKVTPSTDPNAAATALKAANVDVVYIAGINTDCGPDVQALARIGFSPKLVLAPSNCSDQTGWIAAGAAANGVILPSWQKNPGDPALADDAGVKTYLSQVTTADKDNGTAVGGWLMADMIINTLKQAAASSSGLTHLSVIEAARNQTYASPMMINGIKWVSTPTKLKGFDSFQTEQWDAADKIFKPVGALIPTTG